MTVYEMANKLGLKVVCGKEGLQNEISGAYVSDLLSDVMGNASEGQVWITLQTHKNIMAIAGLKELAAVILVKNLEPTPDCAAQANLEHIPILSTELATFDMAGKLYELLK